MSRQYHTLELPSGRIEGVWDLVGRFEDYTGHVPLNGRTVLDVGTASGFLTWEAEKRGATVTSFDIAAPEHLYTLPGALAQDGSVFIRETRAAYQVAHRAFDSKAPCVYGNVYDLSPAFGMFDVVLIGQLLVHLPDAISALAAASSVCRETIVVTEGNFPVDEPVASLCARAANPDISYAWYHYSHGWYREVLAMLGFSKVTITVGEYICNHAHHANRIGLATIVGERDRRD